MGASQLKVLYASKQRFCKLDSLLASSINVHDRITQSRLCSVLNHGETTDDELSELSAANLESIRTSENDAMFTAARTVGMSAVASKILGLVRETVLASAYGVGPVMVAFSYSSLLPTFCLSLLGGVNGPFHNAVTSALSKSSQNEGKHLVQKVTWIVAVVFFILAAMVFLAAERIIDMSAPGFLVDGSMKALSTRAMAVTQLRIMAPCVLLAAVIGIGFGHLSACQVYALPSLSPSLSSMAVIAAVFIQHEAALLSPVFATAMAGGVALAAAVTVGAVAQFTAQSLALGGRWQWRLRLPEWSSQQPWWQDEGLAQVLRVMLPATVASGMLQIATYTDLLFASYLPGTAPALGYANLLVMAPLGVLSTALLVPALPVLSKLAKPCDWPALKERVRQGLIVSASVTLPMTATMVPLASPLVKLLLQRKQFDAAATALVSSLLVCYAMGATAYLVRDFIVRVFYALGDGNTPFVVSMAAIVANIFLDWAFVQQFGPQGLVLATAFINSLSAFVLLCKLSEKLGGLNFSEYQWPAFILSSAGLASFSATKVTFHFATLCASTLGGCNSDRSLWLVEAICLSISTLSGLAVFMSCLLMLRLPAAEFFWNKVKDFCHYKQNIVHW